MSGILLLTSLACGGAVPPPAIPEGTWRPDGVSERVWADTLAAWRCAASAGETSRGTVALIDFSLPSDQPRLWVVDLERQQTLFHERVAHGSGSGGRWATTFSNEPGSHSSSLGLYRGAETYRGKHGRSLRLDGLEPSNAAARRRDIVVHAADYVDEPFVTEHGRAGRSWGCPALDPDVAQEVIDVLADGTLLLAWHPTEDWRATSPWLACGDAETVHEAFPPPAGFVRVEADAFGAWLGKRPLRAPEVPVRTHDGRRVGHRARVLELPVVPGDLQQCADTAIRLRAEWLRETGGEIVFHATSGDPMPWARWQAGERPVERNNRLAWVPGTQGGWEAYLAKVFTWAGTRSLAYDTKAATEPRPGDVVVVPGSPGHAILLLDVARKDGQTVVLVGEGYMPAQDAHVELGPVEGWWSWEDGVALDHWTLPASGLRRWE